MYLAQKRGWNVWYLSQFAFHTKYTATMEQTVLDVPLINVINVLLTNVKLMLLNITSKSSQSVMFLQQR